MEPTNPLEEVRRLARLYLDGDLSGCEIWAAPLAEARKYGLDADDLMAIIASELGSSHCYDSQPTRKYHPDTTSDYFSIWIDDCACLMFIKLLVSSGRLHISSFKKDRRYA